MSTKSVSTKSVNTNSVGVVRFELGVWGAGGAAALASWIACGSALAAGARVQGPYPSPRTSANDPRIVDEPPTPTPDPNRFTFVTLPDTQNYSEFYPEIYNNQTQWVVDNAQSRNIKFVSHVGDVVNHGDRPNEWANAKAAMNRLHAADIPYGVTAGNHDITPSGSAGTAYLRQPYLDNFGPQTFAGKSWYKGASPTGMSNYQTFSGGGREFLVMHLECDTSYEELVWAQGVLNRNRDKATVITTHKYLQDAEDYTGGVPIVPSGRYPSVWYGVEGLYNPSGIQSEEFFQNFVRMQKNVFMVQCGHFHEEFRQQSQAINGNTVHEVLADYQDDPNGGDGWLRLMDFDLAANKIHVDSYSTTRNEFRSASESKFSLDVDFDRYRTTQGVAVFQQGVNAYQGTKDTWVSQANRTTSYGNNQTIVVDDDVNNSIFSDNRGQGLLRFDEILTTTNEAGKVPMGAMITSAELRIHVPDDIDTPFASPNFMVYLLTRPWDENSTWDSLVGGLVAGQDFGTLIGTFSGDNQPDGDQLRVLNVTSAVQFWASGGANYGFAIIPEIISGNDDGIEIYSSEAANILLRPVLDVQYIRLIPAPGPVGVALLAGLLAARRRRG
jgi:hypothetical protein